jgi:ascorbate-specific PTS system EIIC-type component UlaA
MDLDFLHAFFQFPVAAIELTVAIAMADLIAVSEQVRTHIWPAINNALITLVGLVLLKRLVGVCIGPRAYVGAAMIGGLLLGVGSLVVRQGW